MKVDYINSTVTDDYVRCTFVGYDKRGRRRPVIDLDISELRRLIEIAQDFRKRQRFLAGRANARIRDIEIACAIKETP